MSTVYSGIRTVKFPCHHNILCKITLDVPSEKLLLCSLRRSNSLIRWILNSRLIHIPNSKAMSLYA